MKMLTVFMALILVLATGLTACAGTEAPETTAPADKLQIPDPGADGILKHLMIGNSFRFYYAEELTGQSCIGNPW